MASCGVDVYRIEAVDPYPQDYEQTVERNKQEHDDDARPAIAGPLPALSDYDTVLLGSPIWNVRPPMIMRTFIDGVDLSGTVIHPFVTYAVSGMGNTVDDYTRACPDSSIKEGLAVQGEQAQGAEIAVRDWLQRTRMLSASRASSSPRADGLVTDDGEQAQPVESRRSGGWRLGADYLDIDRPARLVPAVPIEDTVDAIGVLVDAGLVRHIGLSAMPRETNEHTIGRSLTGRTAAARRMVSAWICTMG